MIPALSRLPVVGGGAPMDFEHWIARQVGAGLFDEVAPLLSSGWTRYGDGSEMLPDATNLVRDPQCVSGSPYWVTSSSEHLPFTPNVPVPVDFGEPAKCGRLQFDGVGQETCESEPMAATAGQKHTLQCLIYAPDVAAGGSITIAAVVMNGAAEVRTVTLGTVSAHNSTSVRYANTVTIAASGETHIKYRYTFSGAAVTAYVSGHKNADLAYLDPYHDGATPGCVWTAAANQSTSTRTGTVLRFPSNLAASWSNITVAARIMPLFASTDLTTRRFLTLIGAGDSGSAFYVRWGGSIGWDTYATNSTNKTQTFAAGSVHHVIAQANDAANLLDLSIDDLDANQQVGAFSLSWGSYFYLTVPAQPPLHRIGPIIIAPALRLAAWKPAFRAESWAPFSDPVRLCQQFMGAGDILIPLRTNAKAYVKR
jgi:hypothetical protein